jgi:DNA-binding transcriptional LysR family regulator
VHFETIGRRVDIIREGYDVAFRIDLEQETDLSLTMRKMGKSRRILVASPAFLEEQSVIDLETLGDIPTLTIGDHIEHERWLLVRDSGEERKISLTPRFCSNDSVQVRQAAIEGLGVAMLHEQSCLIDCEEGRLVRILPEWHSVDGIVHMVFAAREGMSAAKRAFIDHYADQVFFPDRPADS